ncbi:MBL fold metallo-hydrolase, partial [Chloroflexota bacterium]
MHVQFLGAHNLESQDTKYISLLIDDVLALEAGALASSLTFAAQQQLRAVLLTHRHYDHVRDIPALGMNFLLHENTLDVYTTKTVYEFLAADLLNDRIYPNFIAKPPEKPAIRLKVLEPNQAEQIGGYQVLAVPVNHCVPTVGYQVTSADGKTLFYTGDTGPGLEEC